MTACIACGAHNETSIGGPGSAFDSNVGGKVFHHPPYRVLCCENCGLYYKSDGLPIEQLGDYYARLDGQIFEFDGNFPTDEIVQQQFRQLKHRSRILDFGCSTGRILNDFCSSHDCYGVELNDEAAKAAAARGITMITEEDLRSSESMKFDVILLTDVYEHLAKPLELMELLARHLNTSGKLIVVTGNGDAVTDRKRLAEFWYFRLPGHFLMISKKHASWLASKLGCVVDQLSACSHYRTPMMNQLRQRTRAFAYRHLNHSPPGFLTYMLRCVPLLNRASRWPNAPALTCTADHLVVVLRKQ